MTTISQLRLLNWDILLEKDNKNARVSLFGVAWTVNEHMTEQTKCLQKQKVYGLWEETKPTGEHANFTEKGPVTELGTFLL